MDYNNIKLTGKDGTWKLRATIHSNSLEFAEVENNDTLEHMFCINMNTVDNPVYVALHPIPNHGAALRRAIDEFVTREVLNAVSADIRRGVYQY